ncbi:adaptor protein MecA [Limosilactobacillus viscerum]|uniref:adaptor protein MecA n=1 Tax=Limosilactobacillus viscerum TaxID=2993450 RepID=UPI0024BB774E|nr:adaptor protein MecA [Limosilactobacillus viscerum]
MEMERINENTIRVLISNDDLDARGITILDLLGDHQQIEDFFYSILREVDTDHQFTDNDSVTFQVMPTGNGLELFISKNSANEKLNSENNEQIAQYIKQNIADARQAATHDQQPDKRQTSINSDGAAPEEIPAAPRWRVVMFSSFEDLIDYAGIQENTDLVSELYKYNDRYYLALWYYQSGDSENTIKDNLAIAYEYGNPTATSVDFLSEHAKKIMSGSALETIYHYFK